MKIHNTNTPQSQTQSVAETSSFSRAQNPHGSSLPTPTFHNETLETAWANHSEKLHGPPYEREAAMPQSPIETCKIHSQVTHKVQTRPWEAPKSGLSRRSGLLLVILM
jgi:hypothetical protein